MPGIVIITLFVLAIGAVLLEIFDFAYAADSKKSSREVKYARSHEDATECRDKALKYQKQAKWCARIASWAVLAVVILLVIFK